MLGFLVELAAGLLVAGGGGYMLLRTGSALELLVHGLGLALLGLALYVWRTLFLQAEIARQDAEKPPRPVGGGAAWPGHEQP